MESTGQVKGLASHCSRWSGQSETACRYSRVFGKRCRQDINAVAGVPGDPFWLLLFSQRKSCGYQVKVMIERSRKRFEERQDSMAVTKESKIYRLIAQQLKGPSFCEHEFKETTSTAGFFSSHRGQNGWQGRLGNNVHLTGACLAKGGRERGAGELRMMLPLSHQRQHSPWKYMHCPFPFSACFFSLAIVITTSHT